MKLKMKLVEIVTAESFLDNHCAEEMILKLEKCLTDHIQLVNFEKKLVWVYIPDILYIDRDTLHGATFVTMTDRFVGNMGYETVLDTLKNHNFEVSDNKILVNMSKVKKYNSDRGRVYFTEDVNEESIFTYVSRRNIAKFKIQIGKDADIYNEEGIIADKPSKFKLPNLMFL